MPIYKIRGIDVDFPFQAYDCQIVYMEKVIQSLQNKCNALLESPTGTGKTLCLLCAALAWRKSLGDFNAGVGGKATDSDSAFFDGTPSSQQSGGTGLPAIVYTTRTHSQLQQVIRELRRTNYRPKMVVLGSREQLCIHNDVQELRGKAQNNACHFLCKKRKCPHHSRVSAFVKDNPYLGCDPIDIEDLVNIGRTQGPCPYYLSRELHKSVDILFAPYNYLIDRGNRTSLTIQWSGSVLIFDEAHNLESICADAASFDLPSSLLTACISEANNCVDLAVTRRDIEKSSDKSFKPESFAILKALLLKLDKRIAEVPIESKELGFTRPGPYIYELLAELNITDETATMLIDTIDSAVTLLEDAENATGTGSNKSKGTICRLESMGDILRIIFKAGDKAHAKSYRVHVQEAEAKAFDAFKGKASRIFSWWCFNPGVALEQFSKNGVGSIILTSGTLSPLDSFAQELKLEFPVRLENPHVISPNQIWAGVVSTGPSGCSFNSSYRNRDSLAYKQELGNAIANFARIVPDGLLVFFPSYYLLDQCIGCWKDMGHTSSTNTNTIWDRICKHKQPVVEPRQSSLFSSSIEDFMTKLTNKSTSGAIFFAVCRGKVSEGLDFADQAGRAVVITGMPFATRTDPKVRLKREYLDQHAVSQKTEYKILTGEEWYSQLASRAVNQAVGRVIRHRHDYGAIIFCDERFAYMSHQCQMSRWIQPHVKCYSKFGEVVFTLTRFFRDIATSDLPKPNVIDTAGSFAGSKLLLEELMHKSSRKIAPSVPELSNLVRNDTNDKMSILPRDELLSEKTITHSVNVRDEGCSKQSLSSLIRANRSNICSQLGGILPANRCTTPFKNLDPLTLCEGKKPWNPGPKSKDPQVRDTEVIDLTNNFEWDRQPRATEVIVPCSSKKPKLLKIDPDTMLHSEKPISFKLLDDIKQRHLSSNSSYDVSEKQRNLLQAFLCTSEKAVIHQTNRNTQNVQIGPAAGVENYVIAQEAAHEAPQEAALEPALKAGHSGTVSCVEETKGSDFLMQVQEKLSAAEYREFVGYMKALKSKTLKISDVLQSIARLFSSPERLVFLKRFKDFMPAKYRPKYEQILQMTMQALNS